MTRSLEWSRRLAVLVPLCTGFAACLSQWRVPVLITLAGAVLLAGLSHLVRALARLHMEEYRRHPQMRRSLRFDLALAVSWIASAVVLGVGGAVVTGAMVIPLTCALLVLASAFVAFWINAGIAEKEKELRVQGASAAVAELPLVLLIRSRMNTMARRRAPRLIRDLWGRKVPLGEVSLYFESVLIVTIIASAAYAGVAVMDAASQFIARNQLPQIAEPLPPRRCSDVSTEPEVAARETLDEMPPPPTYASRERDQEADLFFAYENAEIIVWAEFLDRHLGLLYSCLNR